MAALQVIFAASGEFALPTLRGLLDSPHRVVTVISQPDRPAGRGRRLAPTPVAEWALRHRLPLLRTGNINAESLPPADLMLVIAFGQKVAPHRVDHPRLGSLNLHASLLPKYRGAAPINWAILRGESITGNSIIRLAEKMDAGNILAQSKLPIGELETAGELHDRLGQNGARLMLDLLDRLAEGGLITETPQDEHQATPAPKLSREAARLDFSRPADEVARRIRGLYPWPGCRVQLSDAAGRPLARMTLVRARPGYSEGSRWRTGEVQTTGHITAGDGSAVEVIEVHPEGRRTMPLADYRRGHPWLAGMRVEAVL